MTKQQRWTNPNPDCYTFICSIFRPGSVKSQRSSTNTTATGELDRLSRVWQLTGFRPHIYYLKPTFFFSFLFSMQSSTPQCAGTVYFETMCGWTKPCWISARGKAETWTHSNVKAQNSLSYLLSVPFWIFYWNISSQIKYAYGSLCWFCMWACY